MYGAWDFAGEIVVDPTIASANGRMGQTNQRGTVLEDPVMDAAGENSLSSIGAPRKARGRVRMSEQTTGLVEEAEWPPPVVGQVRLRLLTDETSADLRGPTACQIQTPDEVAATIAKLGPDPLVDDVTEGEEKFTAVVRKKPTAIGLLLMDQSVVSGIGNVYRAELLFRARQNPHTPGRDVPEEVVRALWRDWVRLLAIGVETGQMMTMDDLDPAAYRAAMASRDDRHWVYHRAGLPCRVCGTSVIVEEAAGRKLYWCPKCQA
jgi:endonuclease-8